MIEIDESWLYKLVIISLLFFVGLELPAGKKPEDNFKAIEYQESCEDYYLNKQDVILQEDVVDADNDLNYGQD